MIYRVLLDGVDIFVPEKRELVLVNPTLSTEINTAGSLEFTLPPAHKAYNSVHPLTSTIEVYEDEELLWFGRPVEVQKDYFAQKKVYCEGALAYFNDSVQRLREYNEISLHLFFRTVIENHNVQVAPNRQIRVGKITMPDKKVYRKLNYESTYDVIHRQILNAEGGYLFLRCAHGVNYIDWLKDFPYTCNQPVEFGLNLLDLTSSFDGSAIATCVLPLGEPDEVSGVPLTIASVNNGSDVIDSEAVSTYGRITKAVNFSGVVNPVTLYQDGEEYLKSTQFSDTIIQCSASELHRKNENYEQFRVGQVVRCHSVPHLLDREFPLVKLSLRLDTAAKEITLGTLKRQTLSRVYKENQATMEHLVEAAASDEVYGIKEQLNDELQEELQDLIDSTTDEELKNLLGSDQDWLDEFKDDLEIVDDPDDPDDSDWLDDPDLDLDKLRDDLKKYIKKQKPAKLKPIKTKMKKLVTNAPKSVKQAMDKVENGWIHQIDGVTQQSGTVNFITMTPQEEEQYNQEQAQQGGDGTS